MTNDTKKAVMQMSFALPLCLLQFLFELGFYKL